jgi:hypothetical protein
MALNLFSAFITALSTLVWTTWGAFSTLLIDGQLEADRFHSKSVVMTVDLITMYGTVLCSIAHSFLESET